MKYYSKILCAALALLCLLSLAACGSAPAAQDQNGGISTVVPGKLTVATSPDFAPYEFYAIGADGTPTLAGFDIALAQYIADYLGLELDIIPMDFDGVLNELAAGSVDLGVAGLSPDPKRMESMDFSEPYLKGGQSFVTVQDKAALFSSLEDTNKAEYSIGAQNGSIQLDLAKQFSPDADIVTLVKVTDIIAELLAGKSYPELAIVLDVPYEIPGSAVGVVKGNEALLKGVNEAIAAALADGSMNRFIAEANELSTGEIIEGLLEDK